MRFVSSDDTYSQIRINFFMNILYIGAGFVGSCSGAVAADSGHQVLVYDIDEKKVALLGSGDRDQIESCLYEKGLGDLLVKNKERIQFTADYQKVAKALDTTQVIFMCLPTPEIGETGESDLRFYTDAAHTLGQALAERHNSTQANYVVIVNKSTVPINMVKKTEQILQEHGVTNFGVVSNPEFLVEGKAIEGSIKPDRVVVGATKEQDFTLMRELYQRFYDAPDVEYIEVNPQEAAAGKLLANFYLLTKLALCFDVVGRTCEAFEGIKFENIRKILMSDERLGGWGLYNSLYAGGSCLIKDTRSLSHQLQTVGHNASFINEVYLANERQLELFLSRLEKETGQSYANKTVAILGLSFKRDTNDVRNTPSMKIVRFLLEQGVKEVHLYDPSAVENFKMLFPPGEKIKYFSGPEEAIHGVDVVILATDWPEFRGLSDALLKQSARPVLMDGRRMLQHRYDDLVRAGFRVIAVGSSFS